MRRKEREITDKKLINSVIETADVCRIAFAENNTPYIVTLNFGYVYTGSGILYFHSAPQGRKIDLLRKNGYVCFEMDTNHELYKGPKACGWGMKYESVVGYGNISEVIDPAERKAGLDSIMAHYGGTGPFEYPDDQLNRVTILKLEIESITGKKA